MRAQFILALSLLRLSAALEASELLTVTDFQLLPNHETRLQLETVNGDFYRLEITSNLVEWQGWVTAVGTGSDWHLDSASPYQDSRFYRAVALEGAGHLTGDHLSTENGDAIIHPINHASLVVSWNGLMIYVDPVGGAGLYTGLPRADLILVTHVHGDHYSSSTLTAVRGAGAPIVAPPDVFNRLSSALSAQSVSLPNGVVTNLMGLTVEAVPAYNSRHSAGLGNSYVLTLGGKRVFFSGDTEDVPEMRGLLNIDVAFLCMNVPFTMTVQAAADAVRAFRPGVVYPYHYRNQDGSFADLTLFKQLVGTDQGVEVRFRGWY